MIDADTLADASAMTADHLEHLRQLILAGSGYSKVSIPQRRRRPREVLMPSVGLDRALKQLRMGIERTSSYEPLDVVHGFVQGRDIVSNASKHLGRDVVLKVDLSDFFGTIDHDMLITALCDFDMDQGCAEMVSGVALVDGSLAQGFSTSPLLSNMVFHATDEVLVELATSKGVTYTRYVDDLIFSGAITRINDDLLREIESALEHRGWVVNPRKTRFMRRGKAQFVTGLYVGDVDAPHIPRSMKKLLRREVYYASRFGITDARLHSPTPIEEARLGGWVHFAAHADPAFGVPLRATWREVVNSEAAPETWSWDSVLDDIEFPEDW